MIIDNNIPKLGMGCWAIGGNFMLDGVVTGYGKIDDDISVKTGAYFMAVTNASRALTGIFSN